LRGLFVRNTFGIAPDEAAPDRNAPLRLEVAAQMAFPFGGLTAAGLRKEAARGNLAIMRIAGKDFVTLAAIEEMMTRCRREAKAHGSISEQTQTKNPSGSSETDETELALASALLTVKGLKKPSPSTSRKNMSRRESAVVTPIR
jgi:hypothetical protein